MEKYLRLTIDDKRLRELKNTLPFILTAPLIYSLIIPALILDAFVQLYQAVCFPVYGIPKVRREDYLKHDRHRLPYLTSLKKVNCAYCAYFNGVIAFVREVAGRTEQYWCPIKHATAPRERHARYDQFINYGEAHGLDEKWERQRRSLIEK